MKPFVNLINGLELELTVGDTKMTHVVGSLSLLDAAFLKENGFGVKIKVIDSFVIAYGAVDNETTCGDM